MASRKHKNLILLKHTRSMLAGLLLGDSLGRGGSILRSQSMLRVLMMSSILRSIDALRSSLANEAKEEA